MLCKILLVVTCDNINIFVQSKLLALTIISKYVTDIIILALLEISI